MFTRSRKRCVDSPIKEKSEASILRPKKRVNQADENQTGTVNSFKFSWNEFTDGDKAGAEGTSAKVVKSEISDHSYETSLQNVGVKRKQEVIKKEAVGNNIAESDDDENVNYMQIRMKNVKDNQDFLASIGIFKAREQLQETFATKKPTVSHRGLKVKKDPVELLPRRKSLRISKIDPDGIPMPEPAPAPEEVLIERLPSGPLDWKDCLYSDDNLDQFCRFFGKASVQTKHSRQLKEEKDSDFNKMSLKEEHVAKVVPGRVFSLDWHPSADSLIAVAGDKYGHIGFWNVLGSEKDEHSIVTAFKPHVKPVSQISFSLSNSQKLYSCSYDATLRCLDANQGVFEEIFSVPYEDDDLFRDFSFVDSNTMMVAHYSGAVSLVDIRTPSTSAEHSHVVSKKSFHTVHVNPSSSNHFITAGGDATINLWDLRSMDKKSPKSLCTLRDHSKTVSSAYYSPDGQQILSCSVDNFILLFSCKSNTQIALSKRVRHNNCTGRWLTKFRPTWHPTMKDVFVTGSMAHPRRIELFTSTTGSIISELDSDNLNSVCSLNRFHPGRPQTLVGANSSGRLHVFM